VTDPKAILSGHDDCEMTGALLQQTV
jgi:hypothetical protein